MPTNNGYSDEFNTLQRSVNAMFSQMRADTPLFASLLKVGQPAINTKHEWIDDQLTQVASSLTANSGLASTSITVSSTAGFEVGSILRFTSSTKAYKSVQCRVVAITSTTGLTVSRPYGGTTDVALVSGDVCILLATPKQENTDAVKGGGYEGAFAYNYTQIFRSEAGISGTTASTRMFAESDLGINKDTTDLDVLRMIVSKTTPPQLERAIRAKIDRLNREINQSVLFGARVQRAAGGENGSMGGILNMITQTTAVNSALTKADLGDIMEDIFANGGASNNYAFVMGTKQGRAISGLKTEANKTIVFKTENDLNVGDYAQRYTADFVTGKGGTMGATIITDTNMPDDIIAVVDLDRISLIPMGDRYFKMMNATQNGQDGVSVNMLSEMTLELRNPSNAHALLTGLAY